MNPIDIYFDLKNKKIKTAQENDEVDDVSSAEALNYYIGFLRLVYMIHQNSHWKCKCENFYANHLLFERLYESAQKRLDKTAEKLIGIFGNDAMDTSKHSTLINKMCEKYSGPDHVENSLKAEQDFCQISEKTFELIKENGNMSLGLDDLIMANHNKSETAIYLLKQSMVD